MARYKVGVKEIHMNYIEIEADSEEDAKVCVRAGQGESVGTKFLRNLPMDTWPIEKT